MFGDASALHLAFECLGLPCMYLCPVCRCGSMLVGWLVCLSVCLPSWLVCMCALEGCVQCSCVVYVGVGGRVCVCVCLPVCFSVSVFVCFIHPLFFFFLRSFPPVSFSCHLQAGLNGKKITSWQWSSRIKKKRRKLHKRNGAGKSRHQERQRWQGRQEMRTK